MRDDLIRPMPDLVTIVPMPQRRFWASIYDEAGGEPLDVRPYMLGSAVRRGMLLRFARYLLVTVHDAVYVELRADAPEGAPKPVLAIAWIPGQPHGANVRHQTHVTQEGLGLI